MLKLFTPTENDIKRAIIKWLVYRGAVVLRINSGAAGGKYQDKKGATPADLCALFSGSLKV